MGKAGLSWENRDEGIWGTLKWREICAAPDARLAGSPLFLLKFCCKDEDW